MTKRALWLNCTLRTRLDMLVDTFSVEHLAFADYLAMPKPFSAVSYELLQLANPTKVSSWPNKYILPADDEGDGMAEFDYFIMPNQVSIAESEARYGKQRHIEQVLNFLNKHRPEVYYLLFDHRPRFWQFLIELADAMPEVADKFEIVTPGTSIPGELLAKGYRFVKWPEYACYVGKRTAGPWSQGVPNTDCKFDVLFAGFQFEAYRQGLIAKYTQGMSVFGIGKTEPALVSVTNNRFVTTGEVVELSKQAWAQLVIIPAEVQASGNWLIPRALQGLAWGQMLAIPLECDPNRKLIADKALANWCYVASPEEFAHKLAIYKQDANIRQMVQAMQWRYFCELTNLPFETYLGA